MGGGDRALDDRDVVGALHGRAAGLEEVDDLQPVGQQQQLILAVEQAQLAALAGGELPHREGLLAGSGHHNSRIASQGSSSLHRYTGPSRQTSVNPSWQ